MNQAQSLSSYTPDFSDMCSDKPTFWDFLPNETTIETGSTGCESNIPFWDFLSCGFSSKIENCLDRKLYGHTEADKVQNIFDVKDASSRARIKDCDSPVGVLNSKTDQVLKDYDDEFWDFLDSKVKNNTENKWEYSSKTKFYSSLLPYDQTNVSSATVLSEPQKLPEKELCSSLKTPYEILNSEMDEVTNENDDFWDFLKTEKSLSEYSHESFCGPNQFKTQNVIEEIKKITSTIDISITPTCNLDSNQFNTQFQSGDIEKSKSFPSCEEACATCISNSNKLVKSTPISNNSRNMENRQTPFSGNIDSLFELDSIIDQENNYLEDRQNRRSLDTNNSENKTHVIYMSSKSPIYTIASSDCMNFLEAKSEQTAETRLAKSTICDKMVSSGGKHITLGDANQPHIFSQSSKEQITWTKDISRTQKLNPEVENNLRVQSNYSEREMQFTEATFSKNMCSDSYGISSCSHTVKSPNNIYTINCESKNEQKSSLVSDLEQHKIVIHDSESTRKENENSEMNLPIISSIFSVSTCPGNLNTTEFPFNIVNVSQSNNCVKNSIKLISTKIDTLNENEKNLMVADKLSSVNSNVILQKNIAVSSGQSLDTNLNSTPPNQNQKANMKRQIQSSPKNSVFRITDSDPVANMRIKLENKIFSKVVESKRLKTNDTEIKRNVTSQGQPDFVNLNVPLIPIKTVHVPSSELEANNITVPNLTPLYLIIPNNVEPDQSQNAELLLIVNNKSVTNNLILNNPVNQAGYNVPAFQVTCATKNSNTHNILNSKDRINASEVKFPSFNKSFVLKNQTNASNYLQHAQVAEPLFQKTMNEVKHSEIPYQVNNVNIYTTSITSSNTTQLSTAHVDLPKNSASKTFQSTNPVQFTADLSGSFLNSLKSTDSKLSQRNKSAKYKKVKPIKSVSIGKDKNAIQQTSIPLKMESVTDPKVFNHSLGISDSVEKTTSNFTRTDLKTIPITRCDYTTKRHQSIFKSTSTSDSTNTDILVKDTNKLNNGKILIRPNVIINTTEMMNKDDLFRPLNNSEVASLNESKFSLPNNCSKENAIVSKLCDPVAGKNETDKKTETRQIVKLVSALQTGLPVTSVPHKSSLDALKKIFPPPISVSVVQTAQIVNKPAVSDVLVLKGANTSNRSQISVLDTGHKVSAKKMNYKPRKMGRKTVRELLQEKYQQGADKAYRMGGGTKVLRPVFKLTASNVLIPVATQMSMQKFPDVAEKIASVPLDSNLDKRPNIMVLPSATKIVTASVLPQIDNRKDPQRKYSFQTLKDPEYVFKKPSDILPSNSPKVSKVVIPKDSYKPRHYDMSILLVGYLKVEDEVDLRGRFRSKFKVLFSKRQFVYDFPVTKCNQVDGSNIETWNQMARILVPFGIVEAIEMINRRINIKVNRYPLVFLWEMRRKSMHSTKGFTEPSGNSIWLDAVQNSLLHKITLRSRQADSLKAQLCQFDTEFLLLFNNGLKYGISVIDASPFEEDLASSNLRKLYRKNKSNCVRRLPWWDSEMLSESPLSRHGDDFLLSSMQVCCSCRISCRSLRCSCVKAVKSCSTEDSKCLCTACDNPLNILESFELSLDFCLGDSCLFQNIYQIKSLRSFLLRDVKLVCCNTVTRVLDCIPGTILCPNTDCNASVEFSWCRAIVCYPERNPRNHCSLCGRCCFSNGRHCPVCNRCYVVTPKCPECPNCLGTGVSTNPEVHEMSIENDLFSTSLPSVEEMRTKPGSKPEIIVLDSSTQH